MSVIKGIGTIFCTDGIGDTTVEKIREALEYSGLDPVLARDLSKRYCFTRAKNRLRDQGIVDEVDENEARWTWQLSERYVQEQKLNYSYKAQFWYDKATEAIGADNDELLAKANELFAHYAVTYLTSDTSTLVKRIFDRQSSIISLRKSGVVYFVPEEHTALLEQVQKFLGVIGADVITAPIGLENSVVREKALSRLAETCREDLSKVVAEIKTLKDAGEALTPRKAKNRWQALLAEVERIKSFGRSLQASTSQLLTQVSNSEFDLGLVADADLDVLAALAHNGKIDGALACIASAAFEGELPTLDDARVQKAIREAGLEGALPDVSETDAGRESFELPVLQNHEQCLVEVA